MGSIFKQNSITIPMATPDIMPTLLELSGLSIPDSVEGISFAPEVLGTGTIEREGVLVASYAPFADWQVSRGGVEYRGVRTKDYMYAKTRKGPWMLFNLQVDPYQLENLVNRPEEHYVTKVVK